MLLRCTAPGLAPGLIVFKLSYTGGMRKGWDATDVGGASQRPQLLVVQGARLEFTMHFPFFHSPTAAALFHNRTAPYPLLSQVCNGTQTRRGTPSTNAVLKRWVVLFRYVNKHQVALGVWVKLLAHEQFLVFLKRGIKGCCRRNF